MFVKPNADAILRLAAAQALQRPFAEIRTHAIESNTLRIDHNQRIYRIAELHYVEQDVSAKALTYRSVVPGVWKDSFESPLHDLKIPLSTGSLALNGLFDDYFATCWSSPAVAPEEHWRRFSYGEPAIRLCSTPRLLLERLMDEHDEFMSLRHFVGAVRYEEPTAIQEWLISVSRDYTSLMDTMGSRVAQSLMLLRSHLRDEKEVRLVCSSLKNSKFPWWRDRVRIIGDRVKLPFDWAGALIGIELGPLVDKTSEQSLKTLLLKKDIRCPITRPNVSP